MLSFGERLRKARERKGLTQAQVMKLTSITDKSLSRYENNATAPDPETIHRLIRLYDISPDYIMGFSTVMGVAPAECAVTSVKPAVKTGSEPYNHLPPDEQQLLQGYRRLDEQDRNRIQERLATMLEADKYSVKVGLRPA